MKNRILANATLASVLSVILAAGAASAETTATVSVQNKNLPGVETGIKASDSPETREAKKALIKADTAMRRSADEIRAFLSGKDTSAPLEPVVIRRDMTAEAMLKADVVDANGKKVASVNDILLDEQGNPEKVIVSQGGVAGLGGKKASFDYDSVKTSTNKDGARVMTGLSAEAIKKAPEAVEPPTRSAKVSAILDGAILDSKGDKIADIENVAFNGNDTQLIVKFNDTFGMGGNLAAMNLESLERVDSNGEVNYRMSAAQTTQFKSYTAAVE